MRSPTSNHLAALGMASFLALGAPAGAQEPPDGTATASVLLNPGQAAVYSLFLPGSGQVYAGEPIRGGLFLAAAGGLTGMAIAGYFLKNDAFLQTAGAGLIVLSVVAPLDAYLLVRDRNAERMDSARRTKGKAPPISR